MRLLRTSMGLAVVGAVIVVCAAFWPANLGGRTTFVATHGTSMLPRFHAGDLAIVQPASKYRVGDIAAYRSDTINTVVLHRIIAIDNPSTGEKAIDGTRFTFRGDNNDFTDPDHPTADQIIGRLRARVPHGGAFHSLITQPVVLFPFVMFVVGAAFLLPGKTRRKRKNGARAPNSSPPDRAGRPLLVGVTLATGAMVLVAAVVWHMPRSTAGTRPQPYQQNATIGYAGPAPKGAAYPDGRLRTGDPVFTRMINTVGINLTYTFATSAGARHTLSGTTQAVADVSSATGWKRHLALTPVRKFNGDRIHDTARLDVGALRRIQNAFTTETGLDVPTVSVKVSWNVHVNGHLEGKQFAADLAPALDFGLTPVVLMPNGSSSSARPVSKAASVSKSGAVALPAWHDHELTIWRIHLSSELARLLSLALVGLCLAGGAIAIADDRRRRSRGAARTIVSRYRHLLVSATAIPRADGRPIVHVDCIEDLVRLAKLHEELIVHADEATSHRFALFTDTVMYVYDVEPTGRAQTPPSAGESAKDTLARLERCAAERRPAPATTATTTTGPVRNTPAAATLESMLQG